MKEKGKGQSLIYKTLHRKLSFPAQRYIFSKETKMMRLVLYEAAWTRPRHAFMSLRGLLGLLGCFFLKKK
jgi:hypothetical protein